MHLVQRGSEWGIVFKYKGQWGPQWAKSTETGALLHGRASKTSRDVYQMSMSSPPPSDHLMSNAVSRSGVGVGVLEDKRREPGREHSWRKGPRVVTSEFRRGIGC